MFYTRPNLPNLGIDLVKLEGGGSCPSQFEGKTTDGRSIYIRYRGGRFSVQVADIGQSVYRGDELINATIGPWLHGDMLLEQACDLAGLTVKGSRPVLTPERWQEASEHAHYLDFSGATTYWIRELMISREGVEAFAARLRQRFPRLIVVRLRWSGGRRFELAEDLSAGDGSIRLGLVPDKQLLDSLLAKEHVKLAEIEKAFSQSVQLNLVHNADFDEGFMARGTTCTKIEGRPIVLARDLRGTVTTQFATADARDREFVEGIVEDVRACFGTMAETVDFANGEVSAPFENFAWFSNDLAEWCHTSSDHFLGISYRSHDMKRPVGVRPAQPS